ncbi:uncharacterized protein [Drosophila bipectinata]|uniref:uncharacterized protein n=1 Tax=Drosophila bipectinata TaxID=42026 RepID=UPI0038B275F8
MVSTADAPQPQPQPRAPLASIDAQAVEDTLGTLREILRELAKDVDSQMGLANLQWAFNEMDRNMLGYLGVAGSRDKLDQLRTDHTLVRHAYRRSVDEMFEWSVSAASTLESLIPLLDGAEASPADKELFWKTIAGVLGAGVERAEASLNHLRELKATALEEHFRATQENLEKDFGPDGVYGRKMQKLQAPQAGEEQQAKKPRTDGTDIGVDVSAKPSEKPTKSFWKKSSKKPTEEVPKLRKEELEKIEALKQVLTGNLEEAIRMTKEMIDHLEADKKRLTALGQLNSGEKNVATLLVAHPELWDGLVPRLQDLKRECLSYNKLRCG